MSGQINSIHGLGPKIPDMFGPSKLQSWKQKLMKDFAYWKGDLKSDTGLEPEDQQALLKFCVEEESLQPSLGEDVIKAIGALEDSPSKDELITLFVERKPEHAAAYFSDFKIPKEKEALRFELAKTVVAKDPETAMMFILHFDLLWAHEQMVARKCDPVNGYTRARNNRLYYYPSLANDLNFKLFYPPESELLKKAPPPPSKPVLPSSPVKVLTQPDTLEKWKEALKNSPLTWLFYLTNTGLSEEDLSELLKWCILEKVVKLEGLSGIIGNLNDPQKKKELIQLCFDHYPKETAELFGRFKIQDEKERCAWAVALLQKHTELLPLHYLPYGLLSKFDLSEAKLLELKAFFFPAPAPKLLPTKPPVQLPTLSASVAPAPTISASLPSSLPPPAALPLLTVEPLVASLPDFPQTRPEAAFEATVGLVRETIKLFFHEVFSALAIVLLVPFWTGINEESIDKMGKLIWNLFAAPVLFVGRECAALYGIVRPETFQQEGFGRDCFTLFHRSLIYNQNPERSH